MSNLTNMFDSRFIPQMIESPVESIIRKIEGDTETYICNRLMELNIDKDILMNQTQEIQRLNEVIAEYERLEKQGLLLRLPYPLGTKDLYFADDDDWYVLDARKIQAQKMSDGKILYEIDTFEFWEEDFGKIVFLTQEEAELALVNRQQSHAEAIMDERNGR